MPRESGSSVFTLSLFSPLKHLGVQQRIQEHVLFLLLVLTTSTWSTIPDQSLPIPCMGSCPSKEADAEATPDHKPDIR